MFSQTFDQYPPESRVWIYTSSRQLNAEEADKALQMALGFVQDWTSHDRRLRAHAELAGGRFLILLVDESAAGASGCGIDKSVRFVQQLGEQLGTDFFDRLLFAYQENGQVQVAHRDEFAARYRNGAIHDGTLVFNPLVNNKGELANRWLLPLGESWHRQMV